MKKLIPVTYFSIGVFGYFLGMYMLLRSQVLVHFNLSETISGLLIALFYLGFAMMPILMGELADRYGKSIIIKICILLAALGNILCGLGVFGLWFFVAGIFICGCGFSAMEGTMTALLCDVSPETSNKHINRSQVLFSIGAVVSPILCRLLLDFGTPWYYMFIAFGCVMILCFFWFASVKVKDAHPVKQTTVHGFNTLKTLKNLPFLLVVAGLILYVGMEESQAFWQENYITKLSTPALGALSLTLYWVGMIPSRFIASFIKEVKYSYVILCAAGASLMVALGLLVSDPLLKLIFMASAGFFVGPLWPMLMGIGAKLNPNNSATAMNILMTSGGVGGMIVPIMAGSVLDITGVDYSVFLLVILCGLLSVFVAILNKKLIRKRNLGEI